MPDQLQAELLKRQPQLNMMRGAQTIQAAPPGDVDPSQIMRGEIPMPGEGLISGLESATASARDLLRGGNIMDKMYAEANPIFKKMESTGMFSNRPTVEAPIPEAVPGAGTIFDPEHVAWVREQQAKVPTLEALGRQLGTMGRQQAPYANVTRMPVQGGVLYDVLQRAAEKAGAGFGNSPGEARLLEHYSKLIR